MEPKEMHGVYCSPSQSWLSAMDKGEYIEFDDEHSTPKMTPAQARYFARKLYRLARAIEKRAENA